MSATFQCGLLPAHLLRAVWQTGTTAGKGRVTAAELQVLIQEHAIFMFPQSVHIWVCVKGKKIVRLRFCVDKVMERMA